MGVTIKDIARKLGVSATAVSKALNDRDDVSEELKKKVKKVAQELDYSTNTIARRLVTNKSNTIGVFILSRQKAGTAKDNLAFHFLTGILEEANQNGYDIVLFSTNCDLLNENSYIKLCRERRVEGAVFTGLRLDDPHIEEIKESPFPVSVIDTEIEGENVSFVSTDNELGVRKALEYLWELGHRKIAMINGHGQAQVSIRRGRAFSRFLQEKGCLDRGLVFEGDFTEESGYRLGEKIVRMSDRPTALFAASDMMALGAIKAFKDNNVRVPEDISVIGFDNISLCEYIDPPLTSVGQNAVEMGMEAIKLIINNLQGSGEERKKLLNPELVERKSCSKANKG